MTREAITPRVPDGRFDLNGKPYMADAKGGLKPVEMIKAQDLLQDEVTRKIVGYALELSDQIARFKEHTWAHPSWMTKAEADASPKVARWRKRERIINRLLAWWERDHCLAARAEAARRACWTLYRCGEGPDPREG
ncbi:MAG: DUF3164 family protein [Phaeovulum sp.]|uniref:DUF3164 family protein n=1 Tax=Phaeovulum sp. TaxID=2934796 RepID=UPI0027305CAC|nr:DUF3164 family protein [Phaeovulum sp.]MDP2064182.1 DUF3164 family protein [Phaeovulum sp.]